MALNIQTFRTRTLTAIVFAVIMLCGLLINYWSFLILFYIIHFGCWIEFQKLSGFISPVYKSASAFEKSIITIAGLGFMTYMTNRLFSYDKLTLSHFGLYLMLISLLIFLIIIIARRNLTFLIVSITGFLYISLSCGLMVDMRTSGIISGSAFSLDFGLIMPLLIIITIWINDTMAYIVGSLIGKKQLSSISPKKTWEGTIGGALIAIIIITACGIILFKADITQLISLTALICIAGIAGDLFESKLKRMAGVKDSGNIMPGHGGFLDRFDSLLFATILVWLYVQLFLK